jgi:hypothetical protein
MVSSRWKMLPPREFKQLKHREEGLLTEDGVEDVVFNEAEEERLSVDNVEVVDILLECVLHKHAILPEEELHGSIVYRRILANFVVIQVTGRKIAQTI